MVKETGYDRGWILSRRLVDRRDCNKRKIGRYHDVIKSWNRQTNNQNHDQLNWIWAMTSIYFLSRHGTLKAKIKACIWSIMVFYWL